ncbi:MAG: DUF1292 domain-containing protein [Lachnospiraceae bacterium]|nr:DUF1292 domain-containing protein [Lachnospiraceae bacterium]
MDYQELETIPFETEDGEIVNFYVLEQTTLSGVNYLLVTDDIESEEITEVYILREQIDEDEKMISYEMLEDEQEIQSIGKIFEELLEDVDVLMD